MYKLKIEDKFSSAHQLVSYKGPCENLHGHSWKVEITIEGTELDEVGMLVDFQILKKKLKELTDQLDHKFLNDILDFSPTSENLAKYVFDYMSNKIPKHVTLTSATIWESATSSVTYYV